MRGTKRGKKKREKLQKRRLPEKGALQGGRSPKFNLGKEGEDAKGCGIIIQSRRIPKMKTNRRKTKLT